MGRTARAQPLLLHNEPATVMATRGRGRNSAQNRHLLRQGQQCLQGMERSVSLGWPSRRGQSLLQPQHRRPHLMASSLRHLRRGAGQTARGVRTARRSEGGHSPVDQGQSAHAQRPEAANEEGGGRILPSDGEALRPLLPSHSPAVQRGCGQRQSSHGWRCAKGPSQHSRQSENRRGGLPCSADGRRYHHRRPNVKADTAEAHSTFSVISALVVENQNKIHLEKKKKKKKKKKKPIGDQKKKKKKKKKK